MDETAKADFINEFGSIKTRWISF